MKVKTIIFQCSCISATRCKIIVLKLRIKCASLSEISLKSIFGQLLHSRRDMTCLWSSEQRSLTVGICLPVYRLPTQKLAVETEKGNNTYTLSWSLHISNVHRSLSLQACVRFTAHGCPVSRSMCRDNEDLASVIMLPLRAIIIPSPSII